MGLDAVRVRVVDLDALGDPGPSALDPAERARADAFRDELERRRYVAAHAELRRELAEAIGGSPAAVRITREPCPACGGPHGRPVTDGVHFSLSRSGRFAAIALADEPCGVDIEGVQDPARLTGLDLFAPGEPAGDPLGTWVRKEALLKATGEGLTRSMATLRADTATADGTVRDLLLPPGMRGAVAVGAPRLTDAPSAPGKVRALASPPESIL
jgi:4'-phosphopantetheinyl transferase